MLTIFKTIIISILVILVLHFGYNYIKNNYSYKKTKDLVGIQTEKYKNILSEVLENKQNKTTCNSFLNADEKQQMEKSLTEYLYNEMQKCKM
jgi:hypothetical protein